MLWKEKGSDGEYYYFLTAAQFNSLLEGGFIGDGKLFEEDDFVLAPNGYYYAQTSNIDDEEYDWLLENDLLQDTYYSKSSQPGGGL